MLKQNIVFVENRSGSLKKVTKILKEAEINIYGFACFDAPELATFRMVCDCPEKAEKLLTENGFMNRTTQVIAIDMKDKVGSLDEFLEAMQDGNINLDYVYTSHHRESQIPVVILHSEEISVTESMLEHRGFRVLKNIEEIKK